MTQDFPKVSTGLDILADDGFARLRGRRVGAICNPTSVDRRMRHLADLLHAAPDVELVALFGPEHGVRGEAQDMIGVDSSVDPATGVRVHSLYGADVASLTPSPDDLRDLDVLIFDVQDVGSRYYTFAATMLYAMKAAAGRGKTFVVLDRPNPIGGDSVEGPSIEPGYESFVGAYPMPIRHGMTVGELARMFHAELELDLHLEIVGCRGWDRAMYWPETGLPWVMPSPNMPTFETSLVYPGGCLLEGTNLSEGRGTTRPFELWGAPWLQPHARAFAATAEEAGVHLRASSFRPMFHKHSGQVCFGIQPHVYDYRRFRPIEFYLRMIAWARSCDPQQFAWRTEPYEFVSSPIAIDLLLGSSRGREAIEAGSLDPGLLSMGVADFRERREPFLLYD